MASGTVLFQSATTATPAAGLTVMADSVNDVDHGVGTAQYIKIMDGATGGTVKAGVSANGLAVDVTRVQGTVQVQPAFASAQSLGTRIAGTVGNLILLAANPARQGAAFYVENGAPLYLKLGSLAGTFSYTLQVVAGGYYEVPFGYTGTISGIWQFANGTVQITEVV